jgi:uncharacterized protein (DUF488 family)
MRMRLYTIGHSRHAMEQFLRLLKACRITKLVDVRRVPYSRLNPQFNRERMADDLPRHEIAYWHLEDLGGLRDPAVIGESRNTAWRNQFLRSYADYAQTGAFIDALEALCQAAVQETCAIMCAEADWRQCHRQILSDYLILRDFDVLHIEFDGAVDAARLTSFASIDSDGTLLYSKSPEQQLPLDLC